MNLLKKKKNHIENALETSSRSYTKTDQLTDKHYLISDICNMLNSMSLNVCIFLRRWRIVDHFENTPRCVAQPLRTLDVLEFPGLTGMSRKCSDELPPEEVSNS